MVGKRRWPDVVVATGHFEWDINEINDQREQKIVQTIGK